MDNKKYEFKSLEKKYEGFLGPAFEIKVGGKLLTTAAVQFSSITVDIDAGESAGGCSFTLEAQYDHKRRKWTNDLLSSHEDLFSTIKVGEELVIKAGYNVKEEIFYGFVDDFTIKYAADSAPSLTVNGIDAKGYLMNAKDRKYMSEKSTSEIVKEILGECKEKGYAKRITVGTIQDYNVQLIEEEIDDYRFLCFLANAHGFNFFVVDGELIFDNVLKSAKPITKLTMGVGLLGFQRTMSLRNQVGKVVIYGIDPKTLQAIKGEAKDANVGGSGKEAGDVAGEFDTMVEKETNMFVHTAEECQRLAQARFNKRAIEFVSGTGQCLGLPELIPGRYIELAGLDNTSNGLYFISKVTHEYGGDGYYTTFEVKAAKSK